MTEKKFQAALSTRKTDTFSPSDALDDVSIFKATGLDTIASFADRQDNDLDPEVRAQHEQAKEQAYFPIREEKGKGKAKGKGKFLVRSSCLTLENRRQRLKIIVSENRMRCFSANKGHWAYDRERAMSSSSLSSNTQTHAARMTTRLHLSSRPEKVTTCFVLDVCSDDSGILADIADQNVLLPKESTGHASDTDSFYRIHRCRY